MSCSQYLGLEQSIYIMCGHTSMVDTERALELTLLLHDFYQNAPHLGLIDSIPGR